MRNVLKSGIATSVMLLISSVASATGDFFCEVNNDQIHLVVSGTTARADGNPLVHPTFTEVKIREPWGGVFFNEGRLEQQHLTDGYVNNENSLGITFEGEIRPREEGAEGSGRLLVRVDTVRMDSSPRAGDRTYVGRYYVWAEAQGVNTPVFQTEFFGDIVCSK